MKYIVKQKFVDKYSAKTYEIGQKIDIKKDRAEEILAIGDFIEKIEEEKAKLAKYEKLMEQVKERIANLNK